MTVEQGLSLVEVANKLAVLMRKNDEKLEAIFDKIQNETDLINNEDIPAYKKYDMIVSIEYLLVKARLECEFEHLKVKRQVADQSTPANLKPMFIKRDTYLAQVSLKLNAIRDDIATLQKVVYTQSTRNIK